MFENLVYKYRRKRTIIKRDINFVWDLIPERIKGFAIGVFLIAMIQITSSIIDLINSSIDLWHINLLITLLYMYFILYKLLFKIVIVKWLKLF